VRDWLHVGDHCRGIELVLGKGRPGETYNIGGNAERDNLTLVETICSAVDARFASDASLGDLYPEAPAAHGKPSASLIRFVEDRPGHDRRYALDTTRIREQLGYSPAHRLTEGLRETVDWYLENESWWRHVLDGSYREPVSRLGTASPAT
jgi:dTDP-glucose 4,6-dehydratase